jgi:hypothetical protein
MAQDGLSPRQRRAIRALLVEKDITAAAVAAKVGRRSITRWLSDPEFLAALRQAEDQSLDEAARLLLAESGPAVASLAAIHKNALNSPASRATAARAILENALRWGELRSLSERLSELEAETYGDQT